MPLRGTPLTTPVPAVHSHYASGGTLRVCRILGPGRVRVPGVPRDHP